MRFVSHAGGASYWGLVGKKGNILYGDYIGLIFPFPLLRTSKDFMKEAVEYVIRVAKEPDLYAGYAAASPLRLGISCIR